jgi:hypothetical protein
MAASPKYKVYSPDGEYRASFKYPADASALVAFLGDGATLRWDHSAKLVLWREGSEAFQAAESPAGFQITVEARLAGTMGFDEKIPLEDLSWQLTTVRR